MVGTPTTPNMNIPQATSRNVSSGSGHNVPVVASSATTSPNNSSSQAEGIYQPKFRQTHSRSASQSVISTTPLSELGNTSMNGNNGGGPRRIESRHKRSQSNAKPAANAAPAPVSNVTYGGVGVGHPPSRLPQALTPPTLLLLEAEPHPLLATAATEVAEETRASENPLRPSGPTVSSPTLDDLPPRRRPDDKKRVCVCTVPSPAMHDPSVQCCTRRPAPAPETSSSVLVRPTKQAKIEPLDILSV